MLDKYPQWVYIVSMELAKTRKNSPDAHSVSLPIPVSGGAFSMGDKIMKCTGIRKDGMECHNHADVVCGGLAVCEYHIPQAKKLFYDADLPTAIKISALADQRFLTKSTFKWFRGNPFV